MAIPRKSLAADTLHLRAMKRKTKRLMGKTITAAAACARPLGRPKTKCAQDCGNKARGTPFGPAKQRGERVAIVKPVKKANTIMTQANTGNRKVDKIQSAVRTISSMRGDQTARLSTQACSRPRLHPLTPMHHAFGRGHPSGSLRDPDLAGSGSHGPVDPIRPPGNGRVIPVGDAPSRSSAAHLAAPVDRPGSVLFHAGPSYCGAPSARAMLALD